MLLISFPFKSSLWYVDIFMWHCPSVNETLKRPILVQYSFWWWQCRIPLPPFPGISVPASTSLETTPRWTSWTLSLLWCHFLGSRSLPVPLWSHDVSSKRPIKVQNLKPLTVFDFFFALARERIFFEIHSAESWCYRSGKYAVCRCVHASFCPKIWRG